MEWEFERLDERVSIDPPSRLIVSVDAAAAATESACGGCGIIGSFENWLEPYFRSGALVPVVPEWWPKFEGPRLYFPSRLMSAPLRAFVDFIATGRLTKGARP